MICLDTNYLILGLTSGSREEGQLIRWNQQGEDFIVPGVVWYEFLCGPVHPKQVDAMKLLVKDIVPFDELQAETAALLFNETGRQRSLRVDAMIAATAMSAPCPLATNNQADFGVFCPYGLDLAVV